MADIQLNSATLATESGGTVVLDSAVTGIPAAGVTGTLPNAVQDNITRLGTVASGVIGSAVTGTIGTGVIFPAGHIVFINAKDIDIGSHTSITGMSQEIVHSTTYMDVTCKSTNPKFLLMYNSASSYADSSAGGLSWAERNPSTAGSATKVLFEGNGISITDTQRAYRAANAGALNATLTTLTKQFTASIGTVIRFELWGDGEYFWHSGFPISLFALEVQQ